MFGGGRGRTSSTTGCAGSGRAGSDPAVRPCPVRSRPASTLCGPAPRKASHPASARSRLVEIPPDSPELHQRSRDDSRTTLIPTPSTEGEESRRFGPRFAWRSLAAFHRREIASSHFDPFPLHARSTAGPGSRAMPITSPRQNPQSPNPSTIFPEIAASEVDAARRFLTGGSAETEPDANPRSPRRIRPSAPTMPVASFGIGRARRRSSGVSST